LRSSGFDPVSIEFLHRRLRIVTVLVILAIGVLGLRLWFLQIVNGSIYRLQSENNRIHLQKIPPFRGMIYDRNGLLLVDNRPSYDMYIIPEDIQDKKKFLDSLDALIGLEPDVIDGKLKKAPSGYSFRPVLVKKNLSREELAVIETNLYNLSGVMIEVTPQRHYIYGDLASHLIGYLGEISEQQLDSGIYAENALGDFIGKYGIEGVWQSQLNGVRGGLQVEVDAAGRKLRVLSKQDPIPGQNISLTIDKDLQALAEDQLEGKKGAIVAMNPNNGEILAMASSPAFDPNLFIGGIGKPAWDKLMTGGDYPLQNRAITGQYPPGSVFKIVLALAGLEEGIIVPEEELPCGGSYTLGNRTYRCWKKNGHGYVNLYKALTESCDVYFYRVGKRLGVDKIAEYSRMCGLDRKTGLPLENEKPGLIPTSEWKLRRWGVPWQQGETVSMAIGQSFVLVTPIQLARLISIIFNGGQIYQPKIINWIGKDGHKTYEFSPTLSGSLNFKPENLELIKKALVAVVNEPQGTGSMGRVKGVKIAGKTGTAQVITLDAEKRLDEDGEIPEEFNDHALFVAIAPADDPKLAVAVVVEHGGHGGSASAPIAGKLFQAYLGIKEETEGSLAQ
jgi:penicillin-binding protein 2